MLDGLKGSIAASAIKSLLGSLAHSKDTQTTIVGLIASVIITIPGLDWSRLLAGDVLQIAHLISGVLVFLIGLWATKANADGKTTAAGVFAGVLQAASGDIQAIVNGLVIGYAGYLTNKPTSAEPPAA